MTGIGHVVAASLIQGNPVLRLAWGFFSHWILDIFVPEYPKQISLKKWPWYLYQVLAVLLFCWWTGDWWAILYGLSADIIEGIYILVKGKGVWHSGKLLFWFHYYHNMIIKKHWTMEQTVFLELVLVILVL